MLVHTSGEFAAPLPEMDQSVNALSICIRFRYFQSVPSCGLDTPVLLGVGFLVVRQSLVVKAWGCAGADVHFFCLLIFFCVCPSGCP